MSEQLPRPEIRKQLTQIINFAENIIRGEYGKEFPPEESLDPSEVFTGPILDLNDGALNEPERTMLEGWIEGKLGAKPDKAPVKAKYRSPDGETDVVVYDVPLGKEEDKWYLSRWQNKGEKPSFIFWSEEWYREQVELGYEEIKDEDK